MVNNGSCHWNHYYVSLSAFYQPSVVSVFDGQALAFVHNLLFSSPLQPCVNPTQGKSMQFWQMYFQANLKTVCIQPFS